MWLLMHCEGNSYAIFLWNILNLIINLKKQSDQTKLRGTLKTGLDSSKNVTVSKD